MSIYDCPVLLNAITTSNQGQIQFLKESQCGFRGSPPFVCCGSYDNYQGSQLGNLKQPVRRDNNDPTQGVLPDRESCGFQVC